MKLTNTSEYHTATLRRIFVVTVRTLRERKTIRAFDARVVIEVGRKNLRFEWQDQGVRFPTMTIMVPKLTGDEFLPLLRQQYGGSVAAANVPTAGLKSVDVAAIAQRAATLFFKWPTQDQLDIAVRAALIKAKIPPYVPLRVRKPQKEKEPKGLVEKRYERVLELEMRWNRKLKLAQTKLKKLRTKRKHYEKKLANRNQEE